MKVLITGGAGHLGIIISRYFLKHGVPVRIFDLDNARNHKSVSELNDSVEISWGDITDETSIRNALEGIDTVVHMAAILPPVADLRPSLANKVNIVGTHLLVNEIKAIGRAIPLIYTSSVAVHGPTPDAAEPICAEQHICKPKGTYAQTKYEAENIIKKSGLDYVILRLSVNMYFNFEISDIKRMFSIPLKNRIEFCHPDNTAVAIVNAAVKFQQVKNQTFIISGGPRDRMHYRDLISAILNVMGLPVPPEYKFTSKPYYLDWYDTRKSEAVLTYHVKTFAHYMQDYTRELSRRFTPAFVPFMRYFVGPVFGWMVVRFM
ncbi:MAG: NAD-dependent epimerase/dehydratase family protein [Dehalococcoidia bacterium]|jgi:nucleoside-diphosphate-sugar epimerase